MSASNDSSETRGSGAINEIVEVSREWAHKLLRRETWYKLHMSLGLKRLQELLVGTCSLNDDPVWLLGLWYGVHDDDTGKSSMTPELHQLLLDDLNSRIWCTYRSNIPALGDSGLTSDVGWGCTLRSGQMLMAEAIARCWYGRNARFVPNDTSDSTASAQLTAGAAAQPLHHIPQQQHNHQQPLRPQQQQQHQQQQQQQQQSSQQQEVSGTAGRTGARQAGGAPNSSSDGRPDQLSLLQLFVDQPGPPAPFSIHNLCSAGATHGVVAGQWLGPWVLCKALAAAAVADVPQQQQHQQQQQQRRGIGLRVHVACDPGGGAPELDPAKLLQLLPSCNSCGGSSSSSAGQQQQGQASPQGLLLLVPLTLGVGKVNERYLPQLSSILSFPQSVGIVGGRPGASLYFVGVQGGAVLYLDPHEVQQVPVLPRDAGSFHCSLPRLMPLTAIDPSLAIGFFCADAGELQDLLTRLHDLSTTAGGAPLLTVQQPGRVSAASDGAAAAAVLGTAELAEGGRADDWELV